MHSNVTRFIARAWLIAGAAWFLACGTSPEDAGPDVLLVIWDTTRADRLGLYGNPAPTTPFLDAFAADARVFTDCLAAASSTTPSHASMFTGLLPSRHGAFGDAPYLDDRHATVAELLRARGYRTYLYSANPHVAQEENLAQGFEVEQHPWDPERRAAALACVRDKLDARDRTSELPNLLAGDDPGVWQIKSAGQVAGSAFSEFLDGDDRRPFFAVLNFMEAHRPLIPAVAARRALMSEEQVDESYRVDRTWSRHWAYCMGLADYSDADLASTRRTYDAAIRELDDQLRGLIEALRARGRLERTVVIVTADHGEMLGEHHLVDHQYALYQPVLHVPLVVRAPGRIAAGRDDRPASLLDLYPTLLELTGVAPAAQGLDGSSLLAPPLAERTRIAEYPAPFAPGLAQLRRRHPQFDPAPWQRTLRALVRNGHKLIWSSDGRHESYDLASDPAENHDVSADPASGALLALAERLAGALPFSASDGASPLDAEQEALLRGLGYR